MLIDALCLPSEATCLLACDRLMSLRLFRRIDAVCVWLRMVYNYDTLGELCGDRVRHSPFLYAHR